MNLMKSLFIFLAKIKGLDSSEFANASFKEIKKLNIFENVEILKVMEKKFSSKYERLLSEKLTKYKDNYYKNITLENNKDKSLIATILFTNVQENYVDDLLNKKPEFYLDISQNPTTSVPKTISSNEEKNISDLTVSKSLSLEKPTETKPVDRKSRYQIDFEEIAYIGKGSFGEVIKVKNRLDGRYYAIKKIKIFQGNFLKKIMREVQTLSLMHHQYVLRYYQAWIEEVDAKMVIINLNIKFINFLRIKKIYKM